MNAKTASRAIAATGTTTPIAILPPVERPPLPVEATAVLLLWSELVEEWEDEEVKGVEEWLVVVGVKVLNDVDVTITTPVSVSVGVVVVGGAGGGGGGAADVVVVCGVDVVVGVVGGAGGGGGGGGGGEGVDVVDGGGGGGGGGDGGGGAGVEVVGEVVGGGGAGGEGALVVPPVGELLAKGLINQRQLKGRTLTIWSNTSHNNLFKKESRRIEK
jgi:hypothetical protein